MTKQAFSNKIRAGANAKKPLVKAGVKKSVLPVVIGKTKKTASASVAIGEKNHASPLPVPKGWPVSSHLTYPTPSCNGGAKSSNTIIDLDSEIPSKKNYLTPGNLLRQACNGSDIYLRKRAVQSTSSIYPSAAAARGDVFKGGPTRFLIIFPGRLSLKAQSPPPPSSNDNTISHKTLKDCDNSERAEEQTNEENGGTTDRKKNPFAPTNPPHLLGKLLPTSLTKEGRMELRIPLPSSSNSAAAASSASTLSLSCDTIQNEHHQHMIVMAGRAIPLSGKYMALSFKRTGGSKDSAPAVGGGVNKKKGTGSIVCKDVFRSVIVLGDSKILDGDGQAVPLEGLTQLQSKNDEEREEDSPLDMLHYGGSDRALDGGGKCNDGRQRKNGGIPIATTTSYSRKDSISSKESEDSDSNTHDVMNIEDSNGDTSDTDEFVPTSANKRKSTGGSKKRGASRDASSDEAVEDLTPARKRTPRRSAETSKISYVDKSSDEDDLDSSDNDENDSDEDDAYKPSRSKITEKPSVTRSTSTQVGRKSKKSTLVLSVDSSEDEYGAEERMKQSKSDGKAVLPRK